MYAAMSFANGKPYNLGVLTVAANIFLHSPPPVFLVTIIPLQISFPGQQDPTVFIKHHCIVEPL